MIAGKESDHRVRISLHHLNECDEDSDRSAPVPPASSTAHKCREVCVLGYFPGRLPG